MIFRSSSTWNRLAVIAWLLAGGAAQAAAPTKTVTQAELGADWPFTASSATLSCVKNLLPVAEVNGKKYGLTGASKGLGYTQLSPDNPVWRDNPSTGAKVSVYKISALARDLCD